LQSLEKHITEIFRKHDCVIIPDFGGFLLNNTPARLSPNTNEIIPPARLVSFNRNLIQNDGLLANYVAQTEKISYIEAVNLIKDKVEAWISNLLNSKELRLDNIGVIYLSEENKWQFSRAIEANFLTSSFGLISLPLSVDEPAVSKIRVSDTKKFKKGIPFVNRGTAKVLALAASVIIFMFSGFYYWSYNNQTPGFSGNISYSKVPLNILNTINFQSSQAGFNSLLPLNSIISADSQGKDVKTDTFKAGNVPGDSINKKPLIKSNLTIIGDFPTNTENKAIVPVEVKKAIPLITKPVNINVGQDVNRTELKYYIIGGSFVVEKNAKHFASVLKKKGYKAEILNNNDGVFRVAYHNEQDSIAADTYLQTVRETNQSAWLLKIKQN
jgi:hypothetical protein